MKGTEITINAFSYKCDVSDRIFTFDSEDKFYIHLRFHRKKCKKCNDNRDEFIEKDMCFKLKNKSISNTNELSKILRTEI